MQEVWDANISPNIWNQYQNQLNVYKKFAESDQVLDILDVGCAQGTLALLLAESGHKVCAVDLRSEFLQYATSRYEKGDIEFVEGNILDIHLPRLFDLIYANQIIEHIVYPTELITKLKRLLKPQGRLVVTTPNGQYVRNNLPSYTDLGDPTTYEQMQFTSDGDGHFFLYRMGELTAIFEQCGFKKIKTKFFESPWISGHIKIRYLHRMVSRRLLKSLDGLTLDIPYLGTLLAHQMLITSINND